jgi:hypothetical protein
MWFAYEEDSSGKNEPFVDYDDVKEDLIILQNKVDDTLGQGVVWIYLNPIDDTDYEVYFDGPDIETPIFEDNVEDLFSSIRVMFSDYEWETDV